MVFYSLFKKIPFSDNILNSRKSLNIFSLIKLYLLWKNNTFSLKKNIFAHEKIFSYKWITLINLWLNNETEECFGGIFTQTSEFKILPEERVRYWNGYMLFYREVSYNGLFQQDVLRNANNKLRQQRREQFTS